MKFDLNIFEFRMKFLMENCKQNRHSKPSLKFLIEIRKVKYVQMQFLNYYMKFIIFLKFRNFNVIIFEFQIKFY